MRHICFMGLLLLINGGGIAQTPSTLSEFPNLLEATKKIQVESGKDLFLQPEINPTGDFTLEVKAKINTIDSQGWGITCVDESGKGYRINANQDAVFNWANLLCDSIPLGNYNGSQEAIFRYVVKDDRMNIYVNNNSTPLAENMAKSALVKDLLEGNGGFEAKTGPLDSQPSGWVKSGSGGGLTKVVTGTFNNVTDSVKPASGSSFSWFKCTWAGTSIGTLMYKYAVKVEPAKTYKLSWKYHPYVTAQNSSVNNVRVAIYNGSTVLTSKIFNGYGTFGWKSLSMPFTTPEGCESISIAIQNTANNKVQVYLDDFQLECTSDPLPMLSIGKNFTQGVADMEISSIKFTPQAYTPIDKQTLAARMTEANAFEQSVSPFVGSAAFQYSETIYQQFTAAIDDASQIYADANATTEDCRKAQDTLTARMGSFVLTRPEAGDVYNLVMDTNYTDYKAKGLAVTPWAGARTDQGGYNVYFKLLPDKNYANNLVFTPTSETDTYTLYLLDQNGEKRYICTAETGYGSGDYTQIRTTTTASKALKIKITPSKNQDGVITYHLLNTEANVLLGCQDGNTATNFGFYTTPNHNELCITKSSHVSHALTLSEAGWSTLMLPFRKEVPEGLQLYTCDGADQADQDGYRQLILTPQTVIKANVPYLVYGEAGTYSFDGTGCALADQYANGLLKGSYQANTVQNSYFLYTDSIRGEFQKAASTNAAPYLPYLVSTEESDAFGIYHITDQDSVLVKGKITSSAVLRKIESLSRTASYLNLQKAESLDATSAVLFTSQNPNLIVLNQSTEHAIPVAGCIEIVSGQETPSVATVALVDQYPFYVPMDFQAQAISYTRHYTGEKKSGYKEGAKGWESIVLPFKPTSIEGTNKAGESIHLKPFTADGQLEAGYKPFWLKKLTAEGTYQDVDFNSIQPNQPYIICMPNHESYNNTYNISGNVVFKGEQVTIAQSTQPDTIQGASFDMSYTYAAKSADAVTYGINEVGSAFENQSAIKPFQAYLIKETSTPAASAEKRTIPLTFEKVTTGLEELLLNPQQPDMMMHAEAGGLKIISKTSRSVYIYRIDGTLYTTVQLSSGINHIELEKGCYLVEHQKVIL